MSAHLPHRVGNEGEGLSSSIELRWGLMPSDGNPITSVLGKTFTRGDGPPPANVLAASIAGHELPATGVNLALTLALGISLISTGFLLAAAAHLRWRQLQPHIARTWFWAKGRRLKAGQNIGRPNNVTSVPSRLDFSTILLSKTVEIYNNTGNFMTLGISSDDIIDNENGCTHSAAVVDDACGPEPDQGDLGKVMLFAVYLAPSDSGAFASTLYDMQQAAELSSTVPSARVSRMKITAEIPLTSGSEKQLDSARMHR